MVKIATRGALLDRWRAIEEEEEQNEDDDPLNLQRLRCRKEEWFADTFNFLISLPRENHIWCGFWDLMGPLLETFYNYFKDERSDSPLRLLWKRISAEMRHCVQCISQHHQAQEMYSSEYESSSIGPLLHVLQCLDEERVTQHLREMNSTLKNQQYDPLRDNADVVSLMYEVLMFPVLLDDQSLSTEFESFIGAVDSVHELALASQQQFPGVYALLFFGRRVRTIGRRLARSMDKLRRAADMEPLQPLLNKFLGFLEADALPSASNTSRPRVQLEHQSIWLGITSLLEFLEPPVFEEAILERYPIFFDMVLNHISGDSAEFSHAVSCLKELFKMLGCKLWLRSTLSPSVMRNTLLGQCFHTRNEKIHKDIFDLFPPFLQSLEALQDGEHEKQRRHFLYFLLHQVSVSGNFNILTRKLACKIALLIVNRGYTMIPPCPPVECAHMWGPSLVCSLKDSSLHISLRQPAFDLIQAIIVSDATALATMMLNNRSPLDVDRSAEFHNGEDDDDDDGLLFSSDVEEKDTSCWWEFSVQRKITSQEYRGWMCAPLLWVDVLVDIDPSVFPVSFSKAVFWARAILIMIEPETAAEMSVGVRSWLLSSATEISNSFGWKIPTGSDDGGGGMESKNSVRVSMMHLPLLRTFNRLAAHFIVQMGQSELLKQWTWEPKMAESLVLSLMDPNDSVRQVGKRLLEQVSDSRGLACGLKFLCSSISSLSATFFGLRHASKLVQLGIVISKFHMLQHFFFILQKLLKEGETSDPVFSENSNTNLHSSQGGFLMQPNFNSMHKNVVASTSNAGIESLEKFCCLLSEASWPSILKCLVEGKEFIDHSICQMTCVRVLEILPVVFKRLYPSFIKYSRDFGKIMRKVLDFRWLHDLVDWGKSSLKVILVYWKRTFPSLLSLLRGSCSNTMAFTAIENLLSCESVNVDQLMEQVSLLRVSLSKEVAWKIGDTLSGPKALFSKDSGLAKKYQAPALQPAQSEDTNMELKGSVLDTTDRNIVVILSDDEAEIPISPAKVILPDNGPGDSQSDSKTVSHTPADDTTVSFIDLINEVSIIETPRDLLYDQKNASDKSGHTSQKQVAGEFGGKPLASVRSTGKDKKEEVKSRVNDSDPFLPQSKTNLKNLHDESVSAKRIGKTSDGTVCETIDPTMKQIVSDVKDDQPESELKFVKKQPLLLAKLSASAPKRQVIQLKTPTEHRFGSSHRLEAGFKRFKPPSLDDWYRPILEINYFEIVGLSSASEDENRTISRLKEVPVCFQSAEHYVEIFRPLVLEEFKAQLYSSFLEMSSWEDMYYGRISVMSVERVDDFHLVRFVHDDNDSTSPKGFAENDLVLLTKEVPQNKPPDIHMVGKVERRERDNKRRTSVLLIRFYFLNGSSRLNQARRLVIERSKWHACRIMSITSQFREFQVLSAIKNIPILPVILNPGTDSRGDKSRELPLIKLSQPLQEVLKSSFNDSQLQAINIASGLINSKKKLELSLIQGPPGTGKTRTIVAIVSALLASLRGTNDVKYAQNGGSKQFSRSFGTRSTVSQSVALARAWQDAALARQMNEDVGRNEKSVECSVRRRILICAQSNAAVDELVSRISSGGLYGNDGKTYKPYIVRVGNAKTIHPNSLPFFIDTLVDRRIAEEKLYSGDAKLESSVGPLRTKLEKLVDLIRYYEAKRANVQDTNSNLKDALDDETLKGECLKEMSDPELEVKLRKLYEQKKLIFKDLSAAQAREKKSYEEIKAVKHKLRKSILKEAELVVTTLSGCGGDLFEVCSESISSHKFGNPSEHTLFDAVVIDEAAQALEPATLIPLQLLKSHGTNCIMVGDPKQLPATVLSNVASKFLYECSMFERLQKAGYPVTMLTKQYRMHPEICRFPSSHFYDGQLLNGEMSNKSASFHETEGLGPYVFYDVLDGQELRGKNSGSFSLHNECEAEAAVEVIRFFKKRYPTDFEAKRMGIITPYKSQLSVLRSRFSSVFGPSAISNMEFNTIDGFQGREVDILILSTVRAAGSGSRVDGQNSSSIGFVADVRRMNVALTRAKLSLWIFGNARTLLGNYNWAALVKDAKERDLVISVKRPYRQFEVVRDNVVLEKSEYHSSKTKHANNVHCSSKHSKEDKQKFQRVCPGNPVDRAVAGDDKNFPSKKKAVHSSKKGSRDSFVHASVATGGDKKLKSVNDVASSENVGDDESMCTERSKKKLEKKKDKSGEKLERLAADKNKNVDSKSKLHNTEQDTSDKNKKMKVDVLKGRGKSFKHDKNLETNTVLAEGSVEGMKGNDRRAPDIKGASEDLIAKRKQQREAVDAILFSSLISSKKKESSKKPLAGKRSVSPSSVVNSGIRPAKTRKGQEESH